MQRPTGELVVPAAPAGDEHRSQPPAHGLRSCAEELAAVKVQRQVPEVLLVKEICVHEVADAEPSRALGAAASTGALGETQT